MGFVLTTNNDDVWEHETLEDARRNKYIFGGIIEVVCPFCKTRTKMNTPPLNTVCIGDNCNAKFYGIDLKWMERVSNNESD